MKLNKYIKKIILIINVSIIMVSCSSLKHANDNQKYYSSQNDKKNTENYVNSLNNTQYNEQVQLKLQELQTNNIIYFDLNQYNITSTYFNILNIHANYLNNNASYSITIEGHADERGTPEYNIALGERRANAVKSYLQSKGALSEQISIVSYGKEKPAVIGHNEEAYAKNRRAVLLIHNITN